ncbi:universal stress protein [Amaricoccus macauensis]|uniref:universal stress protein n=1 Tax=Amaricoccus macauensis TaxID=57001 RepID=UPI003C7BF251
MFKKILVAYDGSKGAEIALDKGFELAKLCNAELLTITVFRHYSLLESSFSMVRPAEPEKIDDAMREYARDIADHAKGEGTKRGFRVRAFIKNGPPSRSIIAFAEEHDVDLIVIGSRGLGSIENYLLGSVSYKVTGLADCPVLVV